MTRAATQGGFVTAGIRASRDEAIVSVDITRFADEVRFTEAERCAEIVSDNSGIGFVPPDGFREVFYKHVEDVTGNGDVWIFNGQSLADWDRFFQELLGTYAAAIRKPYRG